MPKDVTDDWVSIIPDRESPKAIRVIRLTRVTIGLLSELLGS